MKRYRFTHAQRLHGKAAFATVYQQGQRCYCGPLVVVGCPNDVGFCRLGLSVSRKVGDSVRRHKIKRMLREAFRLCQHDWPAGYDLIIIVRKHDPHTLAEYQKLLFNGIRSLHKRWEKIKANEPPQSDV